MTGQAEFHRSEFPFEDVTGNLAFSESGLFDIDDGTPFICIECGLDVYLSFLYMDFSTGSLQLNLDDDRAALFIGQDYYEGSSPYFWDMNMSVQPVPLPAGWVLMISGLLVLGHRRKHATS